MRRFGLVLLLVGAALVGLGVSAEAHALVRSSNPPDGAVLQHAPAQVMVTFTERPDPRLSRVHVLDFAQEQLEKGRAQPAPGDPLTLVVALPDLPNGVYTVSWYTVSAVDGHVATGAFAFGVGVTPGQHHLGASQTTPAPSPLGVAGRWILYVGFALLLGGSWLSAFTVAGATRNLVPLSTAGFAAALTGLAIVAESQRASAEVSWATFFATSLGSNIAMQVAPVLLAGLAVGVAWRFRDRTRQTALGVTAAITGAAIFTHVLASHASASRLSVLMLAAQWAHLTAFAVWMGGLAALLVSVRGAPSELKVQAVRRFSFVAGIALAMVGITGALRAIDEVGALSRLFYTLFGQLVLVKVALFGVLATLGAINRYRNIPVVARRLTGLQRVGRGELTVAAGVLVAAALLTSLAPPSYTQAGGLPAAANQVVVSGSDFGTTVRAQLSVSPGLPGINRFALSVKDYDSGKAVTASRVALRFDFTGQAAPGESMLELKPAGAGTYAAPGSNLSLAGRWTVTAVIERGINSVEIPLTLTTAPPAEQITTTLGPPTVYTIALPGERSVQTYVDPGRSGFNVVHVTFFDASGNELPVADGVVVTGTPAISGPTATLPVKRFDEIGHFAGQGPLTAGRWRFDISATARDGAAYYVYFEETIQ